MITLCLTRFVVGGRPGKRNAPSDLAVGSAGERLVVEVDNKLPESIWYADRWEEVIKQWVVLLRDHLLGFLCW
jgi:hypothetical protein